MVNTPYQRPKCNERQGQHNIIIRKTIGGPRGLQPPRQLAENFFFVSKVAPIFVLQK